MRSPPCDPHPILSSSLEISTMAAGFRCRHGFSRPEIGPPPLSVRLHPTPDTPPTPSLKTASPRCAGVHYPATSAPLSNVLSIALARSGAPYAVASTDGAHPLVRPTVTSPLLSCFASSPGRPVLGTLRLAPSCLPRAPEVPPSDVGAAWCSMGVFVHP